MKNTQVTIRDLALKLGLSISTVSRALRNASNVDPQKKKHVLELAEKLRYQPNRVAQNLRIKRTNTLGVVVPQINLHFFSSVISGIQEYAARHNYGVMICQSLESLAIEQSNIQMLVANRVDGLLISLSSETDSYDHLQTLLDKDIPVVLFDRITESIHANKVIVDDRDGALKATQYLLKTGCRSIAYIGGPQHLYISNQRLKGYTDALHQNGMAVDGNFIFHCHDLKSDVVRAIDQLLSRSNIPDAILCLNDPVAIHVMQILKSRSVRIPGDISVIGFTNEPVSQFIEPSLTTVSQPADEIGRVAAALFIEQMEHQEGFDPVTKTLPTELLIRNSTRDL
jgi:DNA-binding LacI/PurR family transcriptional regulator